MNELIIIKTKQGARIKTFLDQENITYEIYQEEKSKKITETELEQAYREAWSNPNRYKEAQQWEQAAMGDWTERTKKDKK